MLEVQILTSIEFHTPRRTVGVSAARHYIEDLSRAVTLGVLSPERPDARQRYAPFLREGHRLDRATDRQWSEVFTQFLRTPMYANVECFDIDGQGINFERFAYNTLIATGSPVMALLARLGSTCDGFAFIDTQDADWFAEILERASAENILPADVPWQEVIDLAREVASGRLPGPIVTSYSTCESFPDPGVARWEPSSTGDYWEKWEALPREEQWRVAEIGMRARPENHQIAPSTLMDRFGSGHSAFDLIARAARS